MTAEKVSAFRRRLMTKLTWTDSAYLLRELN
jgi:hypothetical protein